MNGSKERPGTKASRIQKHNSLQQSESFSFTYLSAFGNTDRSLLDRHATGVSLSSPKQPICRGGCDNNSGKTN